LKRAIAAQLKGRSFSDQRIRLSVADGTLSPFVTDCPVPMPPGDALRNFARYTGMTQRAAWELLDRVRKTQGMQLRLPPRPGGPWRNKSGTFVATD
jgi:hypothetical protein